MEKNFANTKKYILLFPVAVIIGTVFANFAGAAAVKRWGIFSADYTDKFLSVEIEFSRVLSYVFGRRIRFLIFAALAAMTGIRDKLALCICAYWGFSAGVVLAALSMQYGAGYFIIFFCGIFCHMILYGIGICGMFLSAGNIGAYQGNGNSDAIKRNLRYLISVLIYFAGMLAEAVMNCYVLPAVLRMH